ncbi:hypothetical protein PG993_001962 [Apiospora rasikravindrae]|uniref:Actin cytoskeleton-regulatory complex protein SLA1 n=1 Tax=Apiospora rasikravindrae TaxID=990691 RepID=A0ABR1UF91_9PEZI
MGFLGVYKAVYDYAPQGEGELAIAEGDVLADDDDEPEGLVPNNYVEEVCITPISYSAGIAPAVAQARALYEYTRQTDEELSFPEDAQLLVYDTSDPDWILVGLNGDFGFVPANYIEMGDAVEADTTKAAEPEPEPEPEPPAAPVPIPAPALPTRTAAPAEPEEPRSPPLPTRQPSVASDTSRGGANPQAALAGVMHGRSSTRAPTPPPIAVPPPRQQYFSEESEEEPSPALPTRPRSHSSISAELQSPPPQRTMSRRERNDEVPAGTTGRIAPGGFHMYNINEMVSVMGKKKKMPTTLGVNLKTGVILIAPERAHDGPTNEWTADKMTHYSREGKHVFLELVRPSRSIDFHAGAKDTAAEIVSALGELSGAVKAEGLREVILAGTSKNSQKRGVILYDFMAQGDDEVTVAVGDEVTIIDDLKSEEWWQVRRVKNGKEGVVPSSYIEVKESVLSPMMPSPTGLDAGRSTVAQNRLEEERLTKEAMKRDQKGAEVGPGMRLPERHSSLSATDSSNQYGQQRSNKRENGRAQGSGSGRSGSSKSKPDPNKIRVWTDRTKSFSVEAQFLGLKDGKINLHKMNGVKIAVPVNKMSVKDLEYVELITGISLDEDKPLSEVKRAQSTRPPKESTASKPKVVGASISNGNDYDWFQFFLSCEVAVGLCERYAQAFNKDSMDESVLPDVDATVLRSLGLREGDIIKVMRHLDKRFGREGKKKGVSFAGDEEGEGGLFSGPGGTLRNNTRKGRPAPATQTNDTIDPKAFSQQKESGAEGSSTPSPSAAKPKEGDKSSGGFDDDAWDVKPSKQPEPQPKAAPAPEPEAPKPAPQAPPTQGMLDLSLLSQPLEPVKAQPTAAPQVVQPPPQPAPQQQPAAPQAPGASPAFFAGLAQQQTGLQSMPTGQSVGAQPLNLGLASRQRPIAPQMTQGQGALMPPPPSRPLSAPQSAQPSQFAPPPLQPQMTGLAPPGQSLNDLSQQRMQSQYMGGFQPQQTGPGMMGYNPGAGMQPQQTGFGQQNQFMQPQMTGASQMQSPFADPRASQFGPIQSQPTGFQGGFTPGQQFPQATGVNSFLPPALEPQRTGMPPLQQQPTGFNPGFNSGFNPNTNNNQPQSQPAPAAPLVPQQTGPAPPVRFGVADKIAPQATGRRANLAQATPQNPFGF